MTGKTSARLVDPNVFLFNLYVDYLDGLASSEPLMVFYRLGLVPLPHQLYTVRRLLHRKPIRVIIADEVGLGKTIIAGFIIRHFIDNYEDPRILILVPRNLLDQWAEELSSKFSIPFRVFRSGREIASEVYYAKVALMSLDTPARNSEARDAVLSVDWDLVVFDEAHKLSHISDVTRRLSLARRLCEDFDRSVVLLTATPHRGEIKDYLERLRLIDPFLNIPGKVKGNEGIIDKVCGYALDAIIIRHLKDEVRGFNDQKLFTDATVKLYPIKASFEERRFYDDLIDYLRSKFRRLKRDGYYGAWLVLAIIAKRFSSSPYAGFKTLEVVLGNIGLRYSYVRVRESILKRSVPREVDPDEAEYDYDVIDSRYVEDVIRSIPIFDEADRERIRGILDTVRSMLDKGVDSKLDSAVRIIAEELGKGNRVILFSEYKDTIEYLSKRLPDRLEKMLGRSVSYGVLHGEHKALERRRVVEKLGRGEIELLLSTDVGGEGLNLQSANVVVNYEIPWSLIRLEQRLGRVHRFGQKKDVRMYNLLLVGTKDGDALYRLLERLEDVASSLGGKVVNVIGEVVSQSDVRRLVLEGEDVDSVIKEVRKRARGLEKRFVWLYKPLGKFTNKYSDIVVNEEVVEFIDFNNLLEKIYDVLKGIDVLYVSRKGGRIIVRRNAGFWYLGVDDFRDFLEKLQGIRDALVYGGDVLAVLSGETDLPILVFGVYYSVHGSNKISYRVYGVKVDEKGSVKRTLSMDEIVKIIKRSVNVGGGVVDYPELYEASFRLAKKLLGLNVKSFVDRSFEKYLRAREIRSSDKVFVFDGIPKVDDIQLLGVILPYSGRVTEEPADKVEIEEKAMRYVMRYEREQGRVPIDVSGENLGYDIRSEDPANNAVRFIEVKGHRDFNMYVEFTPNEYEKAVALKDNYWLYVVLNLDYKPVLLRFRDPANVLKIEVFKELTVREKYLVHLGEAFERV